MYTEGKLNKNEFYINFISQRKMFNFSRYENYTKDSCPACPTVLLVKDDERAVFPTKGTALSVGYDLTAFSVAKQISAKTALYDTGLIVQPPPGYYTEILPRSSLSKTGYMLSNSVGIIDPDYRGRLLIALTKVDESAPDLELPFTKCQLILRRAEFYNVRETSSLDDTERGTGGFGSTDKV
jgi:dUTP pyrophosphatase